MKIYKIKVNGKSYRVELEAIEEGASEAKKEVVKEEPKKVTAPAANSDARQVLSPIQGTVVNVKVKPGDRVSKGDVLLIIEAMKLENEVPSPFAGEVVQVLVSKGQSVSAKEVIVTIK